MQSNQGLTLDRLLEKRGVLEPAQAAKVAFQIAQQLGSSAGSFLIHPGRVLVESSGSLRLLPPAAEDLALPAVVEHPGHASPEEIRGGVPDLRSALYSLGCTLYQLLTGQLPYLSADPRTLLQQHLQAEIPDVRAKNPQVSPSLAEIVRELLQKNPEDRIQSPAELCRRLKASLQPSSSPVAAVKTQSAPRPQTSQAAQGKLPVRPASAPPAAPAAARPARTSSPLASPAAATGSPVRSARATGPAAAPRSGAQTAGDSLADLDAELAASPPPRAPGRAPRGAPPTGVRRARGGSKLAGARSLRGKPPRRAREDVDLEEEPAAGPPRKKLYPCAILGAALGVLIGLFWVSRSHQQAEADAARFADELKSRQATALSNRKKELAAQDEASKKSVADFLAKVGGREDVAARVVMLEGWVNRYDGNPYGIQLVDEYIKVWTPAGAAPPSAEDENAYATLKAEAEKLFADGKLAQARDKIREAEIYKSRHGQEIDELFTKYDQAIAAKWSEVQAGVVRAGAAGDRTKAEELLRGALEWGDEAVRKEARRDLESLQEQAVLQAGASEKGPGLLEEQPEAADTGEKKPAGAGGEAPADEGGKSEGATEEAPPAAEPESSPPGEGTEGASGGNSTEEPAGGEEK